MTTPIVSSDSDVAAVLPAEYLEEPIAPIRDGLIHAHAEQQKAYQAKSDYATQQSDIGRATGRYLTALARDRGFIRQPDESDDDLRARALAVPDVVTPAAIVAAVNSILASVGAGECEYLESIADRLYVNNTGGTGACSGLLGVTPINPTRLYPEDFANGYVTAVRPNSSPGSAWAFSEEIGRYFILRVPNLASLDTSVPTPWQSASAVPQRALGTGTIFARTTSGGVQNQSFVYQGITAALDTYRRIADTVNSLIGHSIRWMMISDSRL